MIYLLLVFYQVKHFLCDFPLQTQYMLGKFKPYPDFILPLLSHSAVHGLFTFLIALTFGSKYALYLALLDFVVHGTVDYVKANPDLGGRFKTLTKETFATATDEEKKGNTYFWWTLGADQFAHHLTHYFIIWCLV